MRWKTRPAFKGTVSGLIKPNHEGLSLIFPCEKVKGLALVTTRSLERQHPKGKVDVPCFSVAPFTLLYPVLPTFNECLLNGPNFVPNSIVIAFYSLDYLK